MDPSLKEAQQTVLNWNASAGWDEKWSFLQKLLQSFAGHELKAVNNFISRRKKREKCRNANVANNGRDDVDTDELDSDSEQKRHSNGAGVNHGDVFQKMLIDDDPRRSDVVNVENDWRHGRVCDRLGHALDFDEGSKDIDFAVGEAGEKISAHTLILKLSSEVFEKIITMYEEGEMSQVKLPNVEPVLFKRLLKFIYTDEMDVERIGEFIKLANKFGFYKLKSHTLEVLWKTDVQEDNAIFLLDAALSLEDKKLEERAMKYMGMPCYPLQALTGFLITLFVKFCSTIDVKPEVVFKTIVGWAEIRCKHASKNPSPEYLRAILRDARLYVRYNDMDYDFVMSVVQPSGILSSYEFAHIARSIELQTPTRNLLGLADSSPYLQSEEARSQADIPKAIKRSGENSDNTSSANIPSKQAKLEMEVKKKSESEFAELPEEEDRKDEFRIYSTFIDFRELLDSIRLRYTVRKLVLHNVVLQDAICYRGARVFLPNLEIFYYYMKKDESLPSTANSLPDKTFMGGLTTKQFLFFEKERLSSWTLPQLWSSQVDILVRVRGLRLIDMSHKKKSLTLAFSDSIEAIELLQGLMHETNLQSLHLTGIRFCNLSPTLDSFDLRDAFAHSSNSVTTLILRGVEFRDNKTALLFINQFPNLENLSLYLVNQVLIDFQDDLLRPRSTLKKVAFSNVDIQTYRKKGVVPFASCEELYLDIATWPQGLAENVSALFPSLKVLFIRSLGHCRCSSMLFSQVLEVRSLKYLALCKYPGTDDPLLADPLINIFQPPFGSTKRAAMRFLTKVGVPFTNNGTDLEDFIIRRESLTTPWHLLPKAYRGPKQFDQLHFEMCMLDRFFDDEETTKLVR